MDNNHVNIAVGRFLYSLISEYRLSMNIQSYTKTKIFCNYMIAYYNMFRFFYILANYETRIYE